MQVVSKNLLDTKADAILLTIDGRGPGMGGNLARQFIARFPDSWEEIEQDFCYPIALGTCELHRVPDGIECPFPFIVIASTLNHLENLSDHQKLIVISNALRHGLALAERNGLNSLSTALLVGGWRLTPEEALTAMRYSYDRYTESSLRKVELVVAIPD